MNNKKNFNPSLSVVVLTYNEVSSLKPSYKNIKGALKRLDIDDYEIIISTTVSPDGSHDGTPELAEKISKENEKVRWVHSNSYKGMASDFRSALKLAEKEYVTMVPGSNVFLEDTLANLFSRIGVSEGVIAYTNNLEVRPFLVRQVSRCFVFLCNILFLLRLRYYNGIIIFPTRFVKAVPMSARGGEYAAEIVIYLVKSGVNYVQAPQEIYPLLVPGRTFSTRNVKAALKTMISLFWKIYFKRERVDLNSLR